MKVAIFIVLSLSALAFAGPAFNKNTNNQIDTNKARQQQQHMTTGDVKPTAATEILKQWCFSSQMSQPELTASFKKLLQVVKSSPEDQTTESAVMGERICQGAIVQKSAQSGDTLAQTGADAQAHELIKDVYMDSLIACESRECMQQLVKIINSNKVDTIRASYYMTRIAVTERDSIKDDNEQAKQLAESFLSSSTQSASDAIERQKLFAVSALLNKSLKNKQDDSQVSELKQTAQQVAKTIVERYIKPVSQQEVQQYTQQQPQQQSWQVAKKIAKRNAGLKALANIPGWLLKDIKEVEEILIHLAQNKQEMPTTRQTAIECLEENDSVYRQLKEISFDQDEPIEVRVAALRALMTVVYAGKKDDQTKQQIATEIVDQLVRHCEEQRNQQQDDQFVLYAISYLDNLRTSQQPEHQAIKDCIAKNKQHYMQIQLLCKKFKEQLADIRKSSRNYKLDQEFNQLESGLIIEGDLIYESKHNTNNKQQQYPTMLPKLVRFNMSMPVMGETVNVVEITVRQNQMDQELLGALKLVQGAKFNSESMSKVVDSFKSTVESQSSSQQAKSAEADLSIKVDGCTVVYVCVDDFKSSAPTSSSSSHQRNTRSVYSSVSIIDDIIEHLKRKPVAFNRGFNFNLNQRLAKVLDVDANLIAGLRFESRASGQSSKDFEIVTQIEPRFAFEAIVGPAKMSSKKLLQRVSTKTALGLRLRFKSNELVDVQVDLPMNTMELFTFETQLVEKSSQSSSSSSSSYNYLPNSIYGQEDIYSPDEDYYREHSYDDDNEDNTTAYKRSYPVKRSIFEKKTSGKSLFKFMQSSNSKRSFAHSLETPEDIARATGLRTKLRLVASPSDMSFLVQCVAQKYEPRMQGYRVQVQRVPCGNDQKQFVLSFSTPGSRVDRTMQLRVIKQSNSQRTIVKSDIQSPMMSATGQYEIIYDGRQYAIKAEIASSHGKQWRHRFETGVQRGSQSQSGRIATTYKPYISIDSSYLRRPIQMQGVVSYQQQPKSVISYEFKCPTSGDFVQGKIIFDQRSNSNNKRASARRSMQSPWELYFAQDDLTLTSEIVAQFGEQYVKCHNMIDWDASKVQVSADLSAAYKNLRKSSIESQLLANLKLDKQQQMFTVQRKCPQQERKEFQLTVASDLNRAQTTGHQMVAEYRYNGKRQSNAIVSYKHKIDFSQITSKNVEFGYTVELIASERQLNEKITGRSEIGFDRKMKTLKTEMSSSHGKSCKIDAEFVSFEQHQIELNLQSERLTHRTSIRADQRQYNVQCRTEYDNKMLAKFVLEVLKQQNECKLVVELPTMNSHYAADLKLQPGKLSSVAVQTPRFATSAEFSFESMTNNYASGKGYSFWKRPFVSAFNPMSQLKFKSHLKDNTNQEAYWIDSLYNNSADRSGEKSYLRFNSPTYRSDIEYEPRDWSTKIGLFARENMYSKQQLPKLYSNEESVLNQVSGNKLNLGDKMWMLRGILSSPSSSMKGQQLKQKARQALFEYADRRQSQKHSFNVDPIDERVNFNFERQPSSIEYGNQRSTITPMRCSGDLSTNYWNKDSKSQRPSKLSMQSEYVDFDLDTKPFDGEQSYAKLTALSRHRRSPFSKHESEYLYKKHGGYKAYMKHLDAQQKKHSVQFESDESPKNWAKMSFESDKHGKADYEHKWRKNSYKRPSSNDNDDEYYQNQVSFRGESVKSMKPEWSHHSQIQWEEPKRMIGGRMRRDTSELERHYNTIDYLKHLNARLNSQTYKNQAELYNVDFDYKPESYAARLNVNMPNDMLHASNIEFLPTERLYKLQSKFFNRRTNEPSYEFLASTKPIVGLATAEQEPMFINEQHPLLERAITDNFASNLFRQPLKLDYSDKFGRVARFDYDLSPIVAIGAQKYSGLRQKRAALYYKDDSADFEHQSSYDFYPETLLGGFKQSGSADFNVKTHTKYGPVVLRADSDDQTVELQLESPIIKAKLTTETSTSKRSTHLIKFTVDNKDQRVQLNKIIRQSDLVADYVKDCAIIQKMVNKFDQGKFEHQTELLVSMIDSIFRIKSQTSMNKRPVLLIDGELNRQQEKAYVKIDGERTKGQLVIDLINKSANLVLDVDDKRTVQHQTRVTRLNERFYSLESVTSYKQQPLFKLSGKVSAMILSEPMHLFARRRSGSSHEEHISSFEAVLYEPKHFQITGQYDCLKREARIVFRDVEDRRIQETRVAFDDQTETIHVDARLSSPQGQIYNSHSKINLPGLMQSSKCHHGSCQSELNYAEKSGKVWSAKYAPGGYISANTPFGKRW